MVVSYALQGEREGRKLSEETISSMQKLHEEYRFQRMADSAKIAQRSVEILANLVNELVEAIKVDMPLTAEDADRCLAKIPYLRRVPLNDRPNADFRYILETPMPLSPGEDEGRERELQYLRELSAAQYRVLPAPWFSRNKI
jgi:hypothetical protein